MVRARSKHVIKKDEDNILCVMLQHLMTSENSPIIEYYPLDFKTDLNGKQQEWEAVVLIPFIDEVHTHTHTWPLGDKNNATTKFKKKKKKHAHDWYNYMCLCAVCLLNRDAC